MLRDSGVAGGINECLELTVGHRVTIDPEIADARLPRGCFLRVMDVGSHAERATRDMCHGFP